MSWGIGPLADAWLDARHALYKAEDALQDELTKIFGVELDCEVNIDPVDWDGSSLELTKLKQRITPTDEQVEKIFALGFTVLRIDYFDEDLHTKSHEFNGDFHRVKGYGDKCMHSIPKGAQP